MNKNGFHQFYFSNLLSHTSQINLSQLDLAEAEESNALSSETLTQEGWGQ